VTITSPADGATVSGSVSITADATDDQSVTQVQFFVDGASVGVDSNSSDGWSAAWGSTTATDGTHTLRATATDTIGQTGSTSITVSVNNGSGGMCDQPAVQTGSSGATFTITCANGDVYNVKMIRTVEMAVDRSGNLTSVKGTAVNFQSLIWTWTDIVQSGNELIFSSTTNEGPWDHLTFQFHVFTSQSSNWLKFDIMLYQYVWRAKDPEAKLAVEWEVKKNGTSLGVQRVTYDHFEGDLYHDPILIP